MARILNALLALVLITLPAAAQDQGITQIGEDLFAAGATVILDRSGIDDVFAAGERLSVASAITGGAYMAGRRVEIGAAVGGDVFGAGMEVLARADVAGDLTLAGYDVQSEGAVGGDLRLSGANISVTGPIAGYAILAGDRIRLDAVITGEAHIAASEVEFGPGARIDGKLTLYEETIGQIVVPESVVPAGRIERIEAEGWDDGGMPGVLVPFSWQRAVLSFIGGVATVAVIAALVAALLPQPLAALRRLALASPFRALWFGFLGLSVLWGSVIVSAMTVFGLLAVPVLVLLAVLAGFAGYVIGAYVLGVALLILIGKGEPGTFGMRALAAGAGTLIAGLIALVPLVGWLFALALALVGLGALAMRLFRPAFFTVAPA
ncbi:MAG: hypothetical protein C0524_07020 [Rhodobacter sp.]|nr:hypothetical protein [Rhodobacter sp.]